MIDSSIENSRSANMTILQIGYSKNATFGQLQLLISNRDLKFPLFRQGYFASSTVEKERQFQILDPKCDVEVVQNFHS